MHVQSRHPWRPMQGQISGSEGKTKGAEKKTGRRVLLPVLYFSACSFPRPFKLSLALGLFKGSHEDVCQWTVVFILSVLNWGYIISRESVLNRPYTFVQIWRYCMRDWVDSLLDFFSPKHGAGLETLTVAGSLAQGLTCTQILVEWLPPGISYAAYS